MDHCLCTWLSKDQQFRRIFDIHVYIYTLFFEFFFFSPFRLCVCVCVCKFQIFKRNLTNLLHTHISLCATLLYYFQQERNLILSSLIRHVNKGLKLPNTTHLEWMLSQVINSIQVRNGMLYFFPNLKPLSNEPATYIMG